MEQSVSEGGLDSVQTTDAAIPDYVNDRLLPQIRYYSGKSRQLQTEYYMISIVSIIVLALIPFLTMLSDTLAWSKYLVAISSAIASVLNSVLLLRKTKDTWLGYRAASESLKAEHTKYQFCVGDYSGLTDAGRSCKLVENCEQIMQSERSGWYIRMRTDSDQE